MLRYTVAIMKPDTPSSYPQVLHLRSMEVADDETSKMRGQGAAEFSVGPKPLSTKQKVRTERTATRDASLPRGAA